MSKHVYTIDNHHPASTALRFARFNKGVLTPEFLRQMNEKRFSNVPNTLRMLKAMQKNGLLIRKSEKEWYLTTKGIKAVEELSDTNVRIRVKNV